MVSCMYNNISIIKKWIFRILIVFSILEISFYFDTANIIGCLLFIYAWFLVAKFVFTMENLKTFLLPTLVVFGYAFSYYFLPLVITFIELKPLTFRFEVPYLTFFNNFINVTVIILSFLFAKKCYNPNNILVSFLSKIGYFKKPTEQQIWYLGFIGVCCFIYVIIHQTSNFSFADLEAGKEGGFIITCINNVSTYSIFPICLLLTYYIGYKRRIANSLFVVYCILYLALCITTTRRSTILYPIASLVLAYFLQMLYEGKRIFSGKKVLGGIVAFLLITGPIADLAFAMALQRHNISGTNTFEKVWNGFTNREELHKLRSLALLAIDTDNSSSWSEYYVDNIFMDRFCNLRVQDATLYYATKLGYSDKGMQDFAENSILSKLPTSFLHVIGKEREVTTTPADYMCMRFFDTSYLVGNRVTGDTGSGLFWMGYWYYPFAFVVYFLLFLFFASIVKVRGNTLFIPLPVIATIMTYFTYLINSYGILGSIHLLLRDAWQSIFIYCLIFFIVRIITSKNRIYART